MTINNWAENSRKIKYALLVFSFSVVINILGTENVNSGEGGHIYTLFYFSIFSKNITKAATINLKGSRKKEAI